MIRILTFLFIALLSTTVFAVEDPEKFEAYRQRLKERKIYARQLMRATRHQRSVGTYNPFRSVYVYTPRVVPCYPRSRYVTPLSEVYRRHGVNSGYNYNYRY